MAKTFEELRQAYKELLADNQQLIADSRKLRNEVAELKQLNDGYVKIIAKNQETNNKLMASVQKQTDGDLISRADAIEAVLGLAQLNGRVPTDSVIFQIKALPSADVIEFDFNKYQPRVRNKVNDGRPSADANSEDLIIKGAKGIQDGLYNIKDGKLFKYKAKGGTVRTYPIVPSADAVHGEWEDKEVFNDTDDDHIVEEWQSARCSVCGKYHTTPYMYYFDNFNYCPSCGARMKGGEDE